MRFLTPALTLALLSCAGIRGSGALHHPDLQLHKLAMEAEGSNSLFTSYKVDGPVRWSQGWPWKLDLSGVAWDKTNTATVITARHVVMAAHYIRPAGENLVFHDRAGKRHARRVQQVVKLKDRGLNADVAIGLLDRPLPDGIRRYPLPKPLDDARGSIIGATALVTEQQRKLYFHQVRNMGGSWLHFQFDDRKPSSLRKSLIKGDSGHPSFLLSKGELVLLQTHTGSGAGFGPYYGESELQNVMREVVSELDPTHTFRTVEIDQRTLNDARAAREASPDTVRRRPAPSQAPVPAPPHVVPPSPTEEGQPRPRIIRPPAKR